MSVRLKLRDVKSVEGIRKRFEGKLDHTLMRGLGYGATTSLLDGQAVDADVTVLMYIHENLREIESELEPEDDVLPDGPEASHLRALFPDVAWERAARATRTLAERWDLLGGIGQGAHGIAFHCRPRDRRPGQFVAKVPKEGLGAKERERFIQEVEIVKDLSGRHPSLPMIHDSSVDPADPFYVMDYLPTSLLDADRRNYLRGNVVGVMDMFLPICEALKAAHDHDRKVIHRDLWPRNIRFAVNGSSVVIDFGMAHASRAGGQRLTDAGDVIVQKSWFSAPELRNPLAAPAPNARMDVYSVGKLIWYALACLPGEAGIFDREDHREDPYDLVKRLGDGQMEYVNLVLDHMIKKNPEDRFADFAQVLAELSRVRRLAVQHYYPVRPVSPCRICGDGSYRRLALRNGPHGPVLEGQTRNHAFFELDVTALGCGACGNILFFSPKAVQLTK